jgi:hypothetical protein
MKGDKSYGCEKIFGTTYKIKVSLTGSVNVCVVMILDV